MIMRVLLAKPDLGFEVVGFLDDNPKRGERDLGPYPALGAIDKLVADSGRERSGRGDRHPALAIPPPHHGRAQINANGTHVRARVVPDVLQMSLDQVDVEVLDGIPLLGIKQVSISGPRYADQTRASTCRSHSFP